MFDFNKARTQRSSDLIPADTVAALQMNIRQGDTGEGLWLKKSKDGRSIGLDCEFTILDAEFKGRKFWSRLTVDGPSDGHKQAANITHAMVRAIFESARGIRPDDSSEPAKAARIVSGWGDLDGIRFIGRIGVQPAQGQYAAKNTLVEVITPERPNYRLIEQANGPTKTGAAPVQANQVERPSWAQRARHQDSADW
jgi:hypothetical protein